MPTFTKQLGAFLADAEAAGYVLKFSTPLENVEQATQTATPVVLSRCGYTDCAEFTVYFRAGNAAPRFFNSSRISRRIVSSMSSLRCATRSRSAVLSIVW